MRIQIGRRILCLSLFALLLLTGLGARVYQLQVAEGEGYARMAFQQRTLSLPLASRRGQIVDRNGIPLTDPQPSWGIAAFPTLVADREGVARALAVRLGISETALLGKLEAGTDPRWLATDLSAEDAAAVEEMRLPGIAVGPLGERYGPGALARHLVGYVNSQGGQLGLERALDRELAGDAVPALVTYLDGTGEPLSGLGIRRVVPQMGKPPYTVRTTIDARLQQAVEAILDQEASEGRPWRGAVVVMDAHSGEVLAMASRPQFQYDQLGQLLAEGEGTFLLNRAIIDYPPGSVFKALVAAAALEKGLVSLDEQFYCVGHYDLDGHRYEEDAGGHGQLTFKEAMAQSCNITFLQVGYERLGTEGLREAALLFGFGEPTGALGAGRPWPDEQLGYVPGPDEGGLAQMAFGQGALEATPLQVARAYAALANGGILPQVRLVTAWETPAGEVVGRPRAGEAKQILKPETAALVREALAAVTDPEGQGTGRSAWIPGVGSAGKTGSAEGVDTEGRQSTHAWFAGFLPLNRPRYVITVLVEGGGGGGAAAAPVFRQVAEALLAIPGY